MAWYWWALVWATIATYIVLTVWCASPRQDERFRRRVPGDER